jgi:hypothetical protein
MNSQNQFEKLADFSYLHPPPSKKRGAATVKESTHSASKTSGFSEMQLPVTEFSEIYKTKKLNSVIYLGKFSYR